MEHLRRRRSGAGDGQRIIPYFTTLRPRTPLAPRRQRDPQQFQRLSSSDKAGGGPRPRDKEHRVERRLTAFLQSQGFAAERVPLSGSARGRFNGDVSLPLLGADYTVEVKARENGFRGLYAGLKRASLADRRESLVILPLRLAIEIAKAAERGKRDTP
jgi:hypothetical protein